MKIHVIADTHFGHRALATRYSSRPIDFEARIVKGWHNRVGPEDLVIHLGDVLVGNSSSWDSYVAPLPGRKVLVLGNHDRKPLHWYLTHGFDFCCVEYSWRIFGLTILFSHEPQQEGTFDLNIHGHLHDGRHRQHPTDERHFLLSLEGMGYRPHTLETIVKTWERGRVGLAPLGKGV